MKIKIDFLLTLGAILLCQIVHAEIVKDKRLAPISSVELKSLINTTPLDSPLQEELITRALQSKHLDIAYTEYTVLWKKQQKNAYLNMLRGVAAEQLAFHSMAPSLKQVYGRFHMTIYLTLPINV